VAKNGTRSLLSEADNLENLVDPPSQSKASHSVTPKIINLAQSFHASDFPEGWNSGYDID
jgi:hypothetical protein